MKKRISNIKNPKVYRTLIAIIVVVLVLGGLLYYETHKNRIFIDNSLVSAPITAIAPTAAGTLSELDVYEGQKIKKGDPVAVVGSQTIHADTDGLVIQAMNQIGGSLN